MEPQWEPAREPGARQAWADILRPVATELDGSASELSAQALRYMSEKLPELFPDPESLDGTQASIEANIHAVADMVQRGADPGETELPPATIAEAQSRVRRGVPVAPLLRSYRLAHELIWQWMFDQIHARADDSAQLAAATELCSRWLFAYADTAATLGERFYSAEQERWMRSAAASRAEVIEAVLSGSERSSTRASGRLRYELGRHHVAAIAWIERPTEGTDAHSDLEDAIARLAADIGGEGTLVHPLGALVTSAWISRRSAFDADALDHARIDPKPAPRVGLALGEPGKGLPGFRETYLEATRARRVASLGKRAVGTVTRYRSVALAAMATVDPDQARSFVYRSLGALAGDDDVARRLSATLGVFLDENASRSRAAKRLGLHENTVTYRIRQAQDLLGRPVDSQTLELRVALALLPTVGRRTSS